MANLTFGAEVVNDGNDTAVSGGIQAYTDPNRSNRKGAVVAVIMGDGTILTLGQAAAAASVPVVLPAAQDATAAEDTASANADVGMKMLAVQKATPANTAGTDGDYEFLQMSAGRLWVSPAGSVADDGTTPNNPVMIGGTAKECDGTDPGSVSAEDDVARVITDRNRRLLVNTRHPNGFSLFENHSSAQTNNQLKAAPGAGLSIHITDIVISNGATAGTVKIVEDESGTPADVSQTFYLAINGGAAIHLQQPIRLTANKTLGFTSATVTTHSIAIHGYIAP